MRFLTPGEVGWGRKGCGDSTVPRDPTGRVYCTEVVVGPDRGVAGMAWGGQRRTEDTSALEEPLVLTVQFTRRPRWGDRGRRRDQDGYRWGVTQLCTDSLLRGSHVTQASLQLDIQTRMTSNCSLPAPPACWDGTQGSRCWVSSAQGAVAPALGFFSSFLSLLDS